MTAPVTRATAIALEARSGLDPWVQAGTGIGGQPMQGSRLLRDRDVILFGSVQVVFRAWLHDRRSKRNRVRRLSKARLQE